MRIGKDLFDIAAQEMTYIRNIRRTLFNWRMDVSTDDGFVGEYLCKLQELAQVFLFKSMNMTEHRLSLQPINPEGPTTLYAMANDKVAISKGNVEWYMMNGKDWDLLWRALHDMNADAIAEVDSDLMYITGSIKNLMLSKIKHRSPRDIPDEELYKNIVTAITLHNRIHETLKDAGISFIYEQGVFGEHCIFAERFLTECLVRVLRLHPETFVDETTWVSPCKFTVYYPDEDRDNAVDVSTLDEDIDKLTTFLDVAGVPGKVWDAFINRDKYAVQWLQEKTLIHIGPVEEDEDNG